MAILSCHVSIKLPPPKSVTVRQYYLGNIEFSSPPSEPCRRISRTRLSSQWSYLKED